MAATDRRRGSSEARPTAAQPISTGSAPATAPTTVFAGVRVLSGV